MANTQLLSQRRAEHALREIQKHKSGLVPSEQDPFAKLTASAPAMILQNGLGQAFAFWLDKGKPRHKALSETIKAWLVEFSKDRQQGLVAGDFLGHLHKMEVEEYILWQREALAYLEWLKRYAAAFLEKEKAEENP